MTDHLIPGVFPFTEAELRAATSLFVPLDVRGQMINEVLEICAAVRTDIAEAKEARERSSADPVEINNWVPVFPDELYTALALVNVDTNERVEALLSRWWSMQSISRRAQLMSDAGLHPRDTPTPAVLAVLEQEEAARRTEWAARRAQVAAHARKGE